MWCQRQVLSLDPDIRSAVPTRVSHLVSQGGATRLQAKVDAEVPVQGQATILGVHINLQHE